MDELRVSSINDFVGQKVVIDRLMTHVRAAVIDKRPLEHVLLAGQPGFGKTTLATLIAQELGDEFETLTMPVTEKTLQRIIQNHDGVLLLDEIHAASKREQEALQPLLEFGYLQTKTGVRIETGWLTVIGATTEPMNVIKPLRDRFKIKPHFEDYSREEMGLIVARMAMKAGLELSTEDAEILGQATAGVPRNGADLVLAGKALSSDSQSATAAKILAFCDIDENGLGRLHYEYLITLSKFGGCRGVRQIASAMRESEAVCLDLEVLLFKYGLIDYGSTGRELTKSGFEKVKSRQGNRRVF